MNISLLILISKYMHALFERIDLTKKLTWEKIPVTHYWFIWNKYCSELNEQIMGYGRCMSQISKEKPDIKNKFKIVVGDY